MELVFLNPEYLYLLIFIVLAILAHYVVIRLFPKKAIPFANYATLSRISEKYMFSHNNYQLLMRIIALIFIIFAVSGLSLRIHYDEYLPPTLIVLDASSSMEINDNFQKAKSLLQQLELTYNDVGIMTYSTISRFDAPLDHYTTSQYVELVQSVTPHGISGTDTGTALLNAIQYMRPYEGDTRIILCTDATNSLGTDISKSIEHAQFDRIHVHVVIIENSELVSKKTTIEQLMRVAEATDGSISMSPLTMNLEKKELVLIKLDLYLIIFALVIFLIEWIATKTVFKTVPHDR